MARRNSLQEWSAGVRRTEFARNAVAVQAYVRQFHTKELAKEGAEPEEIVRRDLLAEFRRGTSELIRAGVWSFLEAERNRLDLTQQQLAAKAGVAQSTYSKIRDGESSFESIALFLRAMNIPLATLPTPSATDMTIAGLVRALVFLKSAVFGERHPVLSAEDAEWLLHMDVCLPWQQVLQSEDETDGPIVAECLAASVSIRLRRSVATRTFSQLLKFWREWSAAWEICISTIAPVIREVSPREPVAN